MVSLVRVLRWTRCPRLRLVPQHRRAVILLGGWLLTAPPYYKDAQPHHDPLSKWWQVSAFDTARQCEDAKFKIFPHREWDIELKEHALMPVVRAICVPADYIYPPQPGCVSAECQSPQK